jgi:hypothetical protein
VPFLAIKAGQRFVNASRSADGRPGLLFGYVQRSSLAVHDIFVNFEFHLPIERLAKEAW